MKKHPNALDRRRAGILLHPTSLPSPHGIGDLGPASHAFLDWLADAGQTVWQMLPVGPAGPGDSPYSAESSFAGEPLLISLDRLVDDGLLPRKALKAPKPLGRGPVDFAATRAFKSARLLAAFIEWMESGGDGTAAYRSFARANRDWLDGWCRFGPGEDPRYRAFLQFIFARQWSELRAAARARGILLVGDVPIFTGLDSADVQAWPELFRLRKDGRPEVLTGVPPDMFSRDGQLWGQPHYRWEAHRRDGFRWWCRRFEVAFDRFDAVRIDHFIGFHHAYEVPGGAKNARKGAWRKTPGAELLDAVRKRLGHLPLIAEDLGHLTPEVIALKDRFGLPGMKIVQNAFYGDDSGDLPCHHPPRCVVYPGTHDNDTVLGWWKGIDAAARGRFRRYVGPGEPVADAMLRITATSPADLAVVQMQDALRLGPSARMNFPGTPSGNWRWRLDPGSPSAADARRLRGLAEGAGRVPR